MPPTRDVLGSAIGGVLFLKLSQQDLQRLFKDSGAKVDWNDVAYFTRHALKSAKAAGTVATHFAKHLCILNEALEPQMFIAGAQPAIVDLACYIALIPTFESFPDTYKWALFNVSRWFDYMQHSIAALAPPPELWCEYRMVAFNYSVPGVLPAVASLMPLTGGSACNVITANPQRLSGATTEAESKEKKGKKEKKKEKAPASAEGAGQSDVSKLDIRVGERGRWWVLLRGPLTMTASWSQYGCAPWIKCSPIHGRPHRLCRAPPGSGEIIRREGKHFRIPWESHPTTPRHPHPCTTSPPHPTPHLIRPISYYHHPHPPPCAPGETGRE